MKKATARLVVLVLVSMLFLSACSPGPNPNVKTADERGSVAGFWSGLWYGFIFSTQNFQF